uniref:Putative myosin-10 isoform X1 n=1 Tax=Davidia involucrata TaxID=16924 RepID=A0A5B6YQB4_DAVIN
MDENLNDNESLVARVQQLEQERDELRKDIEQLCVQQAGPSYLVVATRMHFQRTAGLEQEIENLKKKLAACTRENLNLQEELSEAFRIKNQLADLHGAEVLKNMEAEKQVKFFQGCVAAAFAERDHSIMEAEKAKEEEEVMSKKLHDSQKRVEELTSDFLEEKKLTATLQIDLEEQKTQNEIFKKVINKFYEIRQHSLKGFLEDMSWEDKCECLLHDSAETWSFNYHGETSTSKYIYALEEKVEMLRKSVDNLQNKLQMGLEIENHLKKRVWELEKKNILSEETIKKGISGLHHYHSQHRVHIMNLLDEGSSHLKSIVDVIEEKLRQLDVNREQNLKSPQRDVKLDESECRDVHVNTDASSDSIKERNGPGLPNIVAIGTGDAPEALAQALQEKVAALLLLSQQDERHLLERNVNAALQKKMEELQRNLLQVTNEKVKALMELAQMKQEYQLLQEKISHEMKQGKLLADIGERRIFQERDGRLKNLLKKTYLKRWIGTLDPNGDEAEAHLNYEGNVANRRANSLDFARMKIENATLKESLESVEHLTSSVRRLRLSLIKVKESATSEGTVTSMSETLDDIFTEAKLVKTALCSSLPVSWSAEADVRSCSENFGKETIDVGDSSNENVDYVSAAGFEMVEILLLAAQLLKDHITERGS